MELGGGSAEKKNGVGKLLGPRTVGEKKRLRWRFCVEAERVWMRQGRVDCWIREGWRRRWC